MSSAEPSKILVCVEQREGGRVAHLTINNPRKLNTLHATLMREFVAATEELSRDEQLRALVVTGAGDKAFIGGADIDEMAALNADSARGFITLLHRCCDSLRMFPVPVIARVQGYALGGGMELAAACDLRIAADSAVFGMPEVRLGIPSVIEAALLPSLVGWGRTREMLLLGETFSAAQAAIWGLVERVVPFSELDLAVEQVIASLLRNGPGAIRLQKKLIRDWEGLSTDEAIAAGVEAFVAAWQTDEPRRMMAEFQSARQKKHTGAGR